jgi:hypothetical protein
LTGCASRENSTRIDYQMGERVTVGPLTYNVIESSWQSQLGADFKLRIPDQRFLMITVSVTNGGGKEISVPLLSLENGDGKMFLESADGEGVDNWFGLLRTLNPAQTQQGRLLFDVPLSGYKLRLTDGGPTGSEKYTWVEIPMRVDTDSSGDTPGLAPMTPSLKK